MQLDVSELAAPEPYRLAVESLATLPRGMVLKMRHRREPYPLYQTASEMGFCHKAMHSDDGMVEIQFWRPGDAEEEWLIDYEA